VHLLEGDQIVLRDHPALNAVNERLRQDYIDDCQRGLNRWNKVIETHGHDFRFKLPHRAFHRRIGQFGDVKVSPEGKVITEAEWTRRGPEWMPSEQDREFVLSLMRPVLEPGKMAGWIAPPTRGIDGKPIDFEYVKFG
jgi:benzoyl-CoA 2,3-dioxygenase component B